MLTLYSYLRRCVADNNGYGLKVFAFKLAGEPFRHEQISTRQGTARTSSRPVRVKFDSPEMDIGPVVRLPA
jgi:hypothetical protein